MGLPLQNDLPEVKPVPDTPPNHQVYPNTSRRLLECRGVEIVHDKLIHKQYGIMVNRSILFFSNRFFHSGTWSWINERKSFQYNSRYGE